MISSQRTQGTGTETPTGPRPTTLCPTRTPGRTRREGRLQSVRVLPQVSSPDAPLSRTASAEGSHGASTDDGESQTEAVAVPGVALRDVLGVRPVAAEDVVEGVGQVVGRRRPPDDEVTRSEPPASRPPVSESTSETPPRNLGSSHP